MIEVVAPILAATAVIAVVLSALYRGARATVKPRARARIAPDR